MLKFNELDYYSNIPIFEKHALENSKDRNLENCLILVHPYHCSLEKEYMSKIPEFGQYKEKLDRIFYSEKNISLILFEEPKNYSRFTSELVEKHFFDKVIFTKGSSGNPYRRKELEYFENKKVFVGGMYNGLCLSQAISEINEKVPAKNIFPIRELSLNNWFRMKKQGTVFPRQISSFNNHIFDSINFENFSKDFLK